MDDYDFLNMVKRRRTIRNYSGKGISEQQLRYIIEAGNTAPSPHNVRPWYIVGMGNLIKIQQLADRYLSQISYTDTDTDIHMHKRVINSIRQSGAVIGVFLPNWRKEIYPEAGILVWEDVLQVIGAVVQNMLLAGHSLGLGMAWLNQPVEDRFLNLFSKEFDIDGRLMAFATIGHPLVQRHMIPPRYNDEETVKIIF